MSLQELIQRQERKEREFWALFRFGAGLAIGAWLGSIIWMIPILMLIASFAAAILVYVGSCTALRADI